MGDPSLPIDRYDVRGLLYDIAQHEPKSIEPNLKSSDFMSPEDIRVSSCVEAELDFLLPHGYVLFLL